MSMRSRSSLVAALVGLCLTVWPLVTFAVDGGSDTGAFERALAHGAVFAAGAGLVPRSATLGLWPLSRSFSCRSLHRCSGLSRLPFHQRSKTGCRASAE